MIKKLNSLKKFCQLSRFDKPAGTLLLMLPCWWGLAAAQSEIFLYILFGFGAFIMRSFGCIVNDWVDRDFDKKVQRTMNRPIANGSVSINFIRFSLAFYLLFACLIWIYLNNLAKVIAVAGLLLCLIYPWMKRITNWPQLVLGFAFNIGVLVGFSESVGHLTADIWLLYASGICWTLSYDTVYAFQDYEDDIVLNIGSTTRIAEKKPKAFITCWMLLCLLSFGSWLYSLKQISALYILLYTSLCFIICYHIWKWNPKSTVSCSIFFKKHTLYGWFILLIIILAQ